MARDRTTGGGVRQTPSGRWQARFIAPDGNRRSAGTFLTKDQALAAVRGRAAEVDKGTWKEPVRAPLFGDYASTVIELNPVKESTKRNHRSHLRNLLKEFEAWPVDRIKNSDLKAWWSRSGSRPVSRRNAWSVVRVVMAQAVVDGFLPVSPATIKDAWRDVSERRPNFLKEDFEAVLHHVEDPTVRTVLELLWASHGRLGEVLGLNRSDYDAKSGRITITKSDTSKTTKTGKTRSFRLLGRGIVALDSYLAEHPRLPSAPLLAGTRDAARLPRQTVRKAWLRACSEAGLEGFVLHDIRHASLTWLLSTGATLRDVQIRSGHTSLAALQRYLGIDLERDEAVARRADELDQQSA